MSLLRSFTKYQLWAARVLLSVGVILALFAIIKGANTPPRVIQLDPITKVVEVPVEKLTMKTVTEYVPVPDRAQVKQLLKDNEKLHSEVQQLTVSLAKATSRGDGEAVVSVPTPIAETLPPNTPVSVQFKDWRLSFESQGTRARYTLTQQFSIINTVGRTKENVPINQVRLFEIGEHGERLAIPITETTTVATMPDQPHFYMGLRLQGGVGVFPRSTSDVSVSYSAVAAAPWLHRGRIRAAEYTRYAYATPAIAVNDTEQVVGVMPISFNVGTLKHVPVSDVWVSPFVGMRTTDNIKKFAVIFTTTF